MKKKHCYSFWMVSILFFNIHFLFSQTVQLDATFNFPTITNTITGNNRVACIVQQPDGKLLVAGNFNNVNGNLVKGLIRLNSNGTLDPSFTFNPSNLYWANDRQKIRIKLLEQGRILVSGIFARVDTSTIVRYSDMFCLNSDGSLYSGFHLGIPSEVNGIDVQPDGKIIVVGNFRHFYENGSYVNVSEGIIRLNPDGSRDLAFQAGSGFPSLNLGSFGLNNVSVVENGKYLIVGKFSEYNGSSVNNNIIKINPDGTYDNTFNTGNVFTDLYPPNESIVLPDGKFLIHAHNKILRLNSNGNLDTSFSVTTPFNIINDVIRKSDGKILVGYDVINGASGLSNGILQLNENGTHDNSLDFGSGIYPYGRMVWSICVQSDNNVVLGGDFFGYNNTAAQPIFRLRVCALGTKSLVYGCNSYNWNGTTYNTSGTYTQSIISPNGCSRVDTIQLAINSAIPASPTITQTLVSNICGARTYRYTASVVTNGAGYAWTIPASVGGVSGAVVDSGDAANSRIIKVRYTSNEAAFSSDSIRVRAYSGCGQSALRSAKLTNTKLNPPTAPASITITPLQTNVCNARKYRFTAPTLPSATSTATAATGYSWDIIGSLQQSGYVIDSGSFSSQKLVVIFSSNTASAAGDSIRVSFTSACGNSLKKAAKLTNTKLNPPTAPASIVISALGANTCGQPRYRYTAPVLPNATTTSGAATGYEWSISGQWSIGSNAVIDSGTIHSQKMVIRYLNGNVKSPGDTVRCRYTSGCGLSANRSLALNNSAVGNNPPLKPSSITIAIKDTTICGGRKYRYTAPALPLASSSYASASGYNWILPATDIGASLDSGSLNSKVIVVSYTNNRAAISGDSMFVQYNSACGFSPYKSQKLTNLSKSGCSGKLDPNQFIYSKANKRDDAEMIVYPNPTSTASTLIVKSIQNETTWLKIIDMSGRIIETKQIQTNTPVTMGEKLTHGIYVVLVKLKDGIRSTRLIKQ